MLRRACCQAGIFKCCYRLLRSGRNIVIFLVVGPKGSTLSNPIACALWLNALVKTTTNPPSSGTCPLGVVETFDLRIVLPIAFQAFFKPLFSFSGKTLIQGFEPP